MIEMGTGAGTALIGSVIGAGSGVSTGSTVLVLADVSLGAAVGPPAGVSVDARAAAWVGAGVSATSGVGVDPEQATRTNRMTRNGVRRSLRICSPILHFQGRL